MSRFFRKWSVEEMEIVSTYSYLAFVMKERLKKIANDAQCHEKSIPRGVHEDAVDFLSAVVRNIDGSDASCPCCQKGPPTMKRISVMILAGLFPQIRNEEGTLPFFQMFVTLLERLRQPHALSPDDLVTAQQLARFFGRLSSVADDFNYSARMIESHRYLP